MGAGDRRRRRALAIKPANAQAHLWKADSTRQLAAAEKDPVRRLEGYRGARENYRAFIDLTNYLTPMRDWLMFHFIGFGLGNKRHADREASYEALRSSGFLGLCLSEGELGNLLKAREYCREAVKYAPKDPIGHFLLANANRDLFNARERCSDLSAARSSYAQMIKINPDLDESRNARNYLGQIENILQERACRAD